MRVRAQVYCCVRVPCVCVCVCAWLCMLICECVLIAKFVYVKCILDAYIHTYITNYVMLRYYTFYLQSFFFGFLTVPQFSGPRWAKVFFCFFLLPVMYLCMCEWASERAIFCVRAWFSLFSLCVCLCVCVCDALHDTHDERKENKRYCDDSCAQRLLCTCRETRVCAYTHMYVHRAGPLLLQRRKEETFICLWLCLCALYTFCWWMGRKWAWPTYGQK